MPTTAAETDHDTRMACMEVWGGCEAVNAAVKLSGLDAWVYSRPHGENAQAGGDVYYVSACATGRINRLLVADVSGHGPAVREIATNFRDLMRRFVNYLDQGRFVRMMNQQFIESSAANIFATAVVTTFFAPTRSLSICNAGHPPPLVYRAALGEWSFLEISQESHRGANIPLGIVDLEDYEQFDVPLEVGDLVLIYTDSLMEATDSCSAMLGLDGLLMLVKTVADPKNPAALVPALLAAIDKQTCGGLKADDVTALLIHANGTGAHTPLKTRLLAPFRLLRGIYQSACGKGPAGMPDWSFANIGGALFGPLNRLQGRRK